MSQSINESIFSGVARLARRFFVPAIATPPVHRHALAEGMIGGTRQAAHDFVLISAQLVPLTQATLPATRAFVFHLSHSSSHL
jgi:hypothetical protein